MSFDPKLHLHRCDACDRPQNNAAVLVDMRKPGLTEPMWICGAGGCYAKANQRGYFGPSQAPTTS